jgi:hypothetical protein
MYSSLENKFDLTSFLANLILQTLFRLVPIMNISSIYRIMYDAVSVKNMTELAKVGDII